MINRVKKRKRILNIENNTFDIKTGAAKNKELKSA